MIETYYNTFKVWLTNDDDSIINRTIKVIKQLEAEKNELIGQVNSLMADRNKEYFKNMAIKKGLTRQSLEELEAENKSLKDKLDKDRITNILKVRFTVLGNNIFEVFETIAKEIIGGD